MTKPGRTAIAILADRSRSTRPLRAALRAGLTAVLTDLRTDPHADVLAGIAPTGGNLPALRPVAEVTVPSLRPRGHAATRDGLGDLITELGSALSAMPEDERPSRVLVLVVGTDPEITGTRWSRDAVADLVSAQQRDYAWEFAFVGTRGTDAAGALGIAPDRVLACTPSDEGLRAGLDAASALLGRARHGQPWAPVEGFTDAERAAAAPAPALTGRWGRLTGRRELASNRS